jgi:3-dehydroquinate dehydratase-2
MHHERYTMRILVINGPNINLIGLREPELYGNRDYAALICFIKEICSEMGAEAECIQTNHEGAIVDAIQAARGRFDGIVINPAAYTHTSIAILDALKAVGIPAVEVHLTNIQARETFRQISYASQACERTIAGMGFEGYAEAIRYLVSRRL